MLDRPATLRDGGFPAPETNPVRARADWEAMRAACVADPGAFHGDIARATLHWLYPDAGAWLVLDPETGTLSGYDAATLGPVTSTLPADAVPWARAFNDDAAPWYRWFEGGRTNACFNEVDRHVLAGHGDEAALVFEGDRWDLSLDGGRGGPVDCYPVSRRALLLETAKCALALEDLGLKPGDRIALNMPSIPEQIYWTEAAKRLGILYTPVFGGFSDKTLSDRIADAGARVVITADGGWRTAQVVPFKTAYTDPALDNFVAVPVARRLLAETLERLGLAADDRAAIAATVDEALAGEVTVERSDVMRGVGRALVQLGEAGRLDSAGAARARIAIASALVDSPPRVEAVVVVRHTAQPDLVWRPERDRWSHELTDRALERLLAAAREAGHAVTSEAELLALPDLDFVRAIWASCPCRPLDAEYPMFFIYTSGSTGKPKGVVHVQGGYTAGIAHSMKVAFDARPGDVIYVVADPGWITGQSYLISASLTNRVTTLITEGSPVFPHAGRFAASIETHGVTIFKAGVTFLKSVMSDPENLKDIQRHDLGSLRCATFCAEPTSPSVQAFGMEHVVPWYANSYWATEHGGIAFTHFFGNMDFPLRADAHTWALPWVRGDVWVEDADAPGGYRAAAAGEKGEIVIEAPYPYLARTIWGDAAQFSVRDGAVAAAWRGDFDRWAKGYWQRWPGTTAYTQGDFAIRHADGSFSLHGRSDDVINVSGHRMGTEEIEGAILRDKALDPNSPVGNVLVVGAPHREKGLTPLAFVTPVAGRRLTHEDKRRLADLVRTEKGAVAVPADFLEVGQFPETRSGKYVRRMVRALVEGGDLGDASTLRNPESLAELKTVIDDWQRRQRLSDEQQLFDRWRYFTAQYNMLPGGKGKVATVFFSNPPVNALNERAIDELAIVAEHLARQPDVKAVVWTGDGGQFVAGADIRQMLEDIHSVEEARVLPANAQLAFARIEAMDKPNIAVVNGVALGGGLEFALACHYRIAEPTARFGLPEIRLRLLPGYGGTQRLPRLLAAGPAGEVGLRQALEMILGGRTLGASEAFGYGLINDEANDAQDALSLAHAEVRLFLKKQGLLHGAFLARRKAVRTWKRAGDFDIESAIGHPSIRRILDQLKHSGRAGASARALDAIRTGWTQGIAAGLKREADLFARAVVDPEGGKAGIRAFLDKKAAPLPVRSDGGFDVSPREHATRKARLQKRGDLLPVGMPFYPGVTPIPPYQLAWGIARDRDSGAPRHGQPLTHERELIVPVEAPGPNDALVYMLTSEVNFNDIWALTGIPVSPFDNHDNDYQTTGSGGVGLIAALGSEARAQGRLKVGDLVAIYSGTNDLLSPQVGNDPMFADFAIQGYETETGSHAQFLLVQGPQLHHVPGDLTLEQAGSYILNLGTVSRCLFTTLKIAPGRTIFVEGSATGTGLDALRSSIRTGLQATGLVSSRARAEFVTGQGAVGAIDRTDPRWKSAFAAVPEDPAEWQAWEQAGEPILAEYRRLNGGRLADHVVSHAGETAFPRSFQLLEAGGTLAFYGASSGYHFSFMGKPGAASPEAMLQRAGLRGGEAVLLYYGPLSRELLDETGLQLIEAARRFQARTVVVTSTDGQREFLQSLGLEDGVEGIVSLEDLQRRAGANFDWPATMPRLADARTDIDAFKAGVRDYQERVLKPFGSAVGRILRSADNPRGAPDLVIERAGQDMLGVSTSLVKPFTGRVVFSEDMQGRRYTFYAPQVWTRQRRILMPTASILGTHLCNSFEVARMNDMIAAGLLEVTEPTVVPWEGLPEAHQSMWENRHAGATYIVNHALPAAGLRSRDALLEHWAAGSSGLTPAGDA
jgi:acrylyl-CoA reductase (NADPH)/3-hydroxypropionyl-CoA dehydratase/3-hydroxypropionyl-CoA synthetase